MSELGRGLGDVRRGFAFLNKHPRLWGWVAAPAAVTLVLLTTMVILVMRIADSIVGRVTSWLPDAIAGVGGWVIWVIVLAALVVGGLVVFVSVAGIVAGPFNEMLSEAVEEQVTGKKGPPFSIAAFVASALRGIAHGIKRVLVAILGALMLFALGFIPVVGTIAALLLGGYFTARGAAYDCYDAVLSRRDMPYDAKTAYLAARRSRTFGLGAAVAGMLIIPVLNLLALGVGAAGATLAVLDEQPRR
ncbi:MAG: EI24 domain-containing protein [Myxococcota bacterium]|nr:EI24 domain-containing protein [Deltaproteobacteria bacterium]MDQ3338099.1 EI24 domain-containing protein [Myxococcota bacterium]